MKKSAAQHRLERIGTDSLRNWEGVNVDENSSGCAIEMGWGRVIFAHTFANQQDVVDAVLDEEAGRRNISLYPRDPHVLLSLAPQELFLDPSHTYRLLFSVYRPAKRPPRGFSIRRMQSREDAAGVRRVYASAKMVPIDEDFLFESRASKRRSYWVAEDEDTREIIGTVTGIDHVDAFDDPEQGTSLWALAVDPDVPHVGVGEALVRHLAESYLSRGRQHMDLSVMHDNRPAIGLYEKLGFQRVPVFCVKKKNPFNEPLFVPNEDSKKFGPYAKIIVREARRRGIAEEVHDAELGFFSLTLGGRSIVCHESLTELTSAIAFQWCDDKCQTRQRLVDAGLPVPAQAIAADTEANRAFLDRYERVVVKPARGEQGGGVSVDIRDPDDLEVAIRKAAEICETVLLEEFVTGHDLRLVVIQGEVVAAAVRRPPRIVGSGQHTIRALIERRNRRRMRATGGESRIPLDEETERYVRVAGYSMDDVLPSGERLVVRRAANLHTGGTLHDVTDRVHPALNRAAVRAASALRIPVVGMDFIVPAVDGDEFVILEANERPGLANHEPQPTAERFIDFLFPESIVSGPRTAEETTE